MQATSQRIFKDYNIEESRDFSAIIRSGNHACLFDNILNAPKSIKILNLNTGRPVMEFKCELGESIASFNFPYVVTRLNDTLRIWDVTSFFQDPKVIETKLSNISNVQICGKNLVILSQEFDTLNPSYVTVIQNFDDIEVTISHFNDPGIDWQTALHVDEGYFIYSTNFGDLKKIHLADLSEREVFPNYDDIPKPQIICQENLASYRKHTVQSLVANKDFLIGATHKTIKVWKKEDLSKPVIQVPTERKFTLLNLENGHLIGFDHQEVRVWDLSNCEVVHSEENTSSCNIPSFTLYNEVIYRIEKRKVMKVAKRELSNKRNSQLPNHSEKTRIHKATQLSGPTYTTSGCDKSILTVMFAVVSALFLHTMFTLVNQKS